MGRIGAAVLAAAALCLAFGLSQRKFAAVTAFYRENGAALEASAGLLRGLMEQAKGEETEPRDHELYVRADLRAEEAEIVLYWFGRTGRGGCGMVERQVSAGAAPGLAETLDALCGAGVRSVEVYDFSGAAAEGSPCEIWYGTPEGALVCSESGWLTHGYDVTMADGPGYRLHQKGLGGGWFAAVSRYDPDSDYWRY